MISVCTRRCYIPKIHPAFGMLPCAGGCSPGGLQAPSFHSPPLKAPSWCRAKSRVAERGAPSCPPPAFCCQPEGGHCCPTLLAPSRCLSPVVPTATRAISRTWAPTSTPTVGTCGANPLVCGSWQVPAGSVHPHPWAHIPHHPGVGTGMRDKPRPTETRDKPTLGNCGVRGGCDTKEHGKPPQWENLIPYGTTQPWHSSCFPAHAKTSPRKAGGTWICFDPPRLPLG